MSELTITKEAVLRAASKCSNAKEVLKELFPAVFTDPNQIDLSEITNQKMQPPGGRSFIEVRGLGNYKDRAFFLNNDYNWALVQDSERIMVLVPTLKR